jgi:hypothetical protein
MEKFMHQEPMILECEETFRDTPPQTLQFKVIVEQISNAYGVFSCTGQCDSRSCRLEEEHGTLYLSVI